MDKAPKNSTTLYEEISLGVNLFNTSGEIFWYLPLKPAQISQFLESGIVDVREVGCDTLHKLGMANLVFGVAIENIIENDISTDQWRNDRMILRDESLGKKNIGIENRQ